MSKRLRVLFSGLVQGVGFRPFIYRTALHNGLSGFVQNRPDGVLAEIEGSEGAIENFFQEIKNNLPPLADISKITSDEIEQLGSESFHIVESDPEGQSRLHIAPDTSICPDCLKELFDPQDRRYRYPFINCTNCGPRLTIIRDIPYDRALTSMACFPMCPDCNAEYNNPADRRFHAEPNACPRCGPVIKILNATGDEIPAQDPIGLAVEKIKEGHVLAIKGLGGFHLCVDATNDSAVNKLRSRKFREEKPLAIMVRDIARMKQIAEIGADEESLLLSPQRPIVLVKKRAQTIISEAIAPGMKNFGVMLPYTPLHYLLLESFTALVMTSANQTDEPICIGNREAIRRLSAIADFFVIHNRDILVRCDDSIAFVSGKQGRLMRRSRGYAPKPILLEKEYPEVLALGAEMKGTLCLLKDRYAFLSPHIGDLETPQARDFFQETVSLIKRITESDPKIIACDLHPGYYSTQVAAAMDGQVVKVQHHHAHIVSCMAENRISGDVIGIAMDGSGYGLDGAAWGSEFLIANESNFRRLGHIKYFMLAGGEKAVREPWRVAGSLLRAAYAGSWPEIALKINLIRDKETTEMLELVMAKKLNTPLASGLGRVFDGVAALLGLCRTVSFEGQAAMMLEAIADQNEARSFSFGFAKGEDGIYLLDLDQTIRDLVEGIMQGQRTEALSGKFHRTLQDAFVKISLALSQETGLNRIVLTGGCFQNRILLEGCMEKLQQAGLDIYTHRLVPVNDGGIALGQAVVAANTAW